jgi:hypothetical protein
VSTASPLPARRSAGDDGIGRAGQGTTSMFVPPVPDYVGWVDDFFVTFALIDYAGR